MDNGQRFRIDDLRRFATALATAAGLEPVGSAALAAHLLWFDQAGAPAHGIATLPAWLERIQKGEVDSRTAGRITSEHAGTVVLDSQRGLAPLVLAHAARLAADKARDVGLCMVRVSNLAHSVAAGSVVADVALGPQVAWALGPGPEWALALPGPDGLPLVYDSVLAGGLPPPVAPAGLAAWSVLMPDHGWLLGVAAVTALEPLATFHERVAATLQTAQELPGWLLPEPWQHRRSQIRQLGLKLSAETLNAFHDWAGRLGLAQPAPATVPD